jgi:hypothetical protein
VEKAFVQTLTISIEFLAPPKAEIREKYIYPNGQIQIPARRPVVRLRRLFRGNPQRHDPRHANDRDSLLT